MEFYLKEAFQSLKLLEDDFNLTADQGVIDELQSFVADDIEAPAEEQIIDVEADEVEDLQDNYIGKVILECDCCHTRIYKDKEDVIIDEETGLANVEEECPVCSNAFGWNVIGKIEPFKEGEFDDEPEEVDESKVEIEFSDDEVSAAIKESLNEDLVDNDDVNKFIKSVEDADDTVKIKKKNVRDGILVSLSTYLGTWADCLFKNDGSIVYIDCESDLDDDDKEIPVVYDTFEDFLDDMGQVWIEESLNEGRCDEDFVEVTSYEQAKDLGQGTKWAMSGNYPGHEDKGEDIFNAYHDRFDIFIDPNDKVAKIVDRETGKKQFFNKNDELLDDEVQLSLFDESCGKKIDEDFEDPKDVGVDPDTAVEDDVKLETPMENPVVDDPAIALAEELKEEVIDEAPVDPELKAGKPEKVGKWEYSVDKNALDKAMDTIYNKLSEEEFKLLNDNALNAYIDKDPEALKVVKKIFRKYGLPMWALKAFAESWDDQNESLNEGIENLSLDTEDTHMEMSADDDGKVTVVTEPIHDEEVVEVEDEMIAPLDVDEIDEIDNNEEQSAEEVAIEDEFPEEDEFEIDDFNEESFDEIGESYLHRVYENVNSFNTTGVRYEKGKLTVEGLIKFNSGKEKNTEFVFENFRLTKRGKIMTEGMNDTFSKSSKAFILKGTLSDKRFVSESLTYSYNVRQLNESNESEVIRVYGRAVATK